MVGEVSGTGNSNVTREEELDLFEMDQVDGEQQRPSSVEFIQALLAKIDSAVTESEGGQ
jgi:hypothetical protein